jgi:hypothetical protein
MTLISSHWERGSFHSSNFITQLNKYGFLDQCKILFAHHETQSKITNFNCGSVCAQKQWKSAHMSSAEPDFSIYELCEKNSYIHYNNPLSHTINYYSCHTVAGAAKKIAPAVAQVSIMPISIPCRDAQLLTWPIAIKRTRIPAAEQFILSLERNMSAYSSFFFKAAAAKDDNLLIFVTHFCRWKTYLVTSFWHSRHTHAESVSRVILPRAYISPLHSTHRISCISRAHLHERKTFIPRIKKVYSSFGSWNWIVLQSTRSAPQRWKVFLLSLSLVSQSKLAPCDERWMSSFN